MINKFYNPNDIPKDWELSKLKYIFEFSNETSDDYESQKNLSLTKEGIVEKNIELNEGQIAREYKNYIFIKKDQICMNPMDLLSGWVDISPLDGLISPAYYTLIPKENFDVKFLNYFLQSNYYRETFFSIGKGIASHDNYGRWVLTPEEFKNIFIYFPNLKEQKIISKYLEIKTHKIDFLIKNIQKKIELLKEQRFSLINQCVTQGLNPDTEMKDSGVDWIGKIPKHWIIRKLKHISKVQLSSVDRHEHDDELRVNICHYPDVYKNEYISEKTKLPFGTCSVNEFKKFSLIDGDILLTKDSESPEDIGIPALVKGELVKTVCGYHLGIVRVFSDECVSGHG